MADTEHFTHPHVCLRCRAHDEAIPPEAALKILLVEEWDACASDFQARAMTQQQAVAAEMLTTALWKYIRAFGIELAGVRLNSILEILRLQVRSYRANQRILKAREQINKRARTQYARCDYDAAHAIEAEPTPDYPGKARDDVWLNQGQPAAKQLEEVAG